MSAPQRLVRLATGGSVAGLVAGQARMRPGRIAVEDGGRSLSYRDLDRRARRLAASLRGRGVVAGERVAILSENRLEYLETFLAAAHLGAVVACLNWRLSQTELRHCLALADPRLVLASPRHAGTLDPLGHAANAIVFGPAYETALADNDPEARFEPVDPESLLLILYTSGTTGLPKGAAISHRAEVARNLVCRAELGLAPDDTFVAWSPLYHMGGADYSLGTLMCGGKVIVVDGFDAERLVDIVADESLGWLLLMPGMVGRFAALLERRATRVRKVKVCGVMADLVPAAEIARVTRLLAAPYANTFGATETGNPPCSAGLLEAGVIPRRLAKRQSPFCEVRLLDAEGRDVPDGEPGELCMRGPTLFSGYWRAPEANAHEFRDGWFHMGDVFVRNRDGTLDFVDRLKYLIKSGGENIYPAEIERILLRHPGVADAAVVRRRDAQWGEVPVAFVARRDAALRAEDLRELCRGELAGYKQPQELRFIALEAFPRSASGKIQRHELEKRLCDPE